MTDKLDKMPAEGLRAMVRGLADDLKHISAAAGMMASALGLSPGGPDETPQSFRERVRKHLLGRDDG